VPRDKHLQTKAETYTIEGYNSRIRHYLARFKRKGKCYSKAEYMIVISLNLLFKKLNNETTIVWIYISKTFHGSDAQRQKKISNNFFLSFKQGYILIYIAGLK